MIAFFMGKQLERHWLKGQGSRIAAAGVPHLRIRHVQVSRAWFFSITTLIGRMMTWTANLNTASNASKVPAPRLNVLLLLKGWCSSCDSHNTITWSAFCHPLTTSEYRPEIKMAHFRRMIL
jgi:hypothetical protein